MQHNTLPIPAPSTLFKYRGAGKEAWIMEILEGTLYFSPIAEFNDGFEYFYTFTKSAWHNNIQNINVLLTPQERIKQFEPIINDLKKKGGYCLSESDTNLSMWSLYADGHNGICIGFDWDKLKAAGPWNFPERIEYRDTPVDLDSHGGGYDGWHKVFNSKHLDFSFEVEWRLNLEKPGHTLKEKKDIIKNSISRIIFGFRTMECFRNRIIEKCINEEINADFFITKCIPGEYALEISNLNIV